MKLIEAMKQIKELRVKVDDLTTKIKNHCAYLSHETALYKNQPEQITQWLQSIHDCCKKILELRIAIQKTNLVTQVTIELDGNSVTKTIAEWVHRRRDLAGLELASWAGLTDRSLREGRMQASQEGGTPIEVKIVRCFDPVERDKKIESFRSEPSIIDRTLEVANASTELIT